VNDIAASVKALVAAGGTIMQEITDVAQGLLVAGIKEPSGAIVQNPVSSAIEPHYDGIMSLTWRSSRAVRLEFKPLGKGNGQKHECLRTDRQADTGHC
jgi:hypothetical protein